MERTKEVTFKLFNIRYIPLFVLFLILGIFAVRFSYGVAMIIASVAILFAFLLFFTKSVKYGVAIALICVLFAGYGWARLELYLRNEVGLSGFVQVQCRVIDVSASESEEGTSYSVMADDIHSGGSSYGGKISFTTEKALEVGDCVTISGEVAIKQLSLSNIYTALAYRTGAKYTMTPQELSAEKGSPPLSYTIRKRILSVLTKYEGERAGSFSYAMLFGDSTEMYSEDKTAMREVGVAHVFAVSGLHVGVLSAAILFLLRKLKMKDRAIVFVILPIFGFYAYLAGFTPSVLRASIMVTLGLVASAIGARYDDISSLAFAAALILLVKPLYLFDISFIMSFLSIFGIASLSRPLERTFLRHKMKPRLASGLALSVATTVALLPVSAVVFGKISLIGFALNILIVPLASVSFILTWIALLFTLALPSFGALLEAFSLLPLLIAEMSARVAALGWTVSYEFSAVEILLYYAMLAFVGKYSLAHRKVKLAASGMGVGILALLILV